MPFLQLSYAFITSKLVIPKTLSLLLYHYFVSPVHNKDSKMSLVMSSSFLALSIPSSSSVGHCKFPWTSTPNNHKVSRNKSPGVFKPVRDSISPNNQPFPEDDNTISFDWEDEEEIEDLESPWEGAVIYKRNPGVSHMEYCTTLERLALGKLSTHVSKSRASLMGLRVTQDVKDYLNGTPVQISIDVTRKKRKMRLDGIVKTVITLGCNRCGEPAAECIFSNFSLLLCEDPIEEPEMGATLEHGFKSSYGSIQDDDASIDWDDRLYFPPEEKEIDISKHIRDLVHLEIKINAVCDPSCKGICLDCGTNLNTSSCNCGDEVKEKGYGPLGILRKQMQNKKWS